MAQISNSSNPSGWSGSKELTPGVRNFDRGFRWATKLFAISIGLLLGLIVLTILYRALPAIQEFGPRFLVNSTWNPVNNQYGALPMIYGTLVSSLIALLIAVPLGIGTAIFLSEDFIPLQIRTILVFMVELLAAIPSVVYGLWGIFVLIPLYVPLANWLNANFGWIPIFSTPPTGPGMFPAGLVIAIMILPIITTISRDSLAALPSDLRQASLGLGASRWRTILTVLFPAAISGVIGGIMLALGRALGETMAATMIIGNSNQINRSIFAPGNTIASLLANQFAEASGLQVSALMYAAFVLILLTLLVNVLAELIIKRIEAKY